MTKKTQARRDRDAAKKQRSEEIRKQISGELPLPRPRDPMAGFSPAVAQAREAYLRTDPFLFVQELSQTFQDLTPGTPEHDAAVERAKTGLEALAAAKEPLVIDSLSEISDVEPTYPDTEATPSPAVL